MSNVKATGERIQRLVNTDAFQDITGMPRLPSRPSTYANIDPGEIGRGAHTIGTMHGTSTLVEDLHFRAFIHVDLSPHLRNGEGELGTTDGKCP